MKTTALTLLCTLFTLITFAQSPVGAWERYFTDEDGQELRSVLIFADGYQVVTTYHAKTGEFINTTGGSWKLEGDIMTEKVEFHTDDPESVGKEVSFKIKLTNEEIRITGSDQVLKRIDSGKPGELQGAWLMSGRIRDGETQMRDTNRPRKTMKILSGTRFQWIAYNTETKKFKGTGGGTYTTIDGKYTENIEFFSRDNTKAGLSLEFNYELIDGKWHHSGKSTKGDPIHEIWSLRDM